jgi:hypothetical protein
VIFELFLVIFVFGCDDSILGIVGLGNAEQSLQGQKSCSDGKGWRPFILENIKADGSSHRRNVGMPDFGLELHFGWPIGVLLRKLDVNLELSSLIGRVIRSLDESNPMPDIVIEKTDLDRCLFALNR